MDMTVSSGSSSTRPSQDKACLRGSGLSRIVPSLLAVLPVCAALSLPSAWAASPDPLTTLQEYLRLDTSNPPGNEALAAAFFKTLLEQHGIQATIHPMTQGRSNVVARLVSPASPTPGNGRRALLLFNHMDVVQADASRWMVPPVHTCWIVSFRTSPSTRLAYGSAHPQTTRPSQSRTSVLHGHEQVKRVKRKFSDIVLRTSDMRDRFSVAG